MGLLGSFFGGTKKAGDAITNPIDLVTYAINLASNPDDISTIFDQVRDITVRLEPTKNLTPTQEAALLKLYLQLETYLTTKEPIRTFTREGLRSRIDPALLARLNQLT